MKFAADYIPANLGKLILTVLVLLRVFLLRLWREQAARLQC